jgi:type IV pilus assembly protein PilW
MSTEFNNKIAKQSGMSLVEILVAMVISLFLLGGIIQVYMGNKTTFTFTNALAEIQENGRFAMETITRDLRLSGEWGCILFDPSDTSNINNAINAGSYAGYDSDFHDFVNEEGIEGTNGTGLNGSDTLIVRGGKPGQTNVESPFIVAGTLQLNTDTINTITGGDIILVTRCGANDLLGVAEADILPVTSVVPGTNILKRVINLGAAKSQQFENDAAVIELQTVSYSIANGASGEPALFRAEFTNNQELVEGIQDMQILYGIDTSGDNFPNQYVTSNNVPNFQNVVAVRVMLLVRSIDDFVTEDPQTYSFNGVQTTPGDRRIRQVFTTTIALRNRIGLS